MRTGSAARDDVLEIIGARVSPERSQAESTVGGEQHSRTRAGPSRGSLQFCAPAASHIGAEQPVQPPEALEFGGGDDGGLHSEAEQAMRGAMVEALVVGGVVREEEAEAARRLGLRELAAAVASSGLDAARFEDEAISAAIELAGILRRSLPLMQRSLSVQWYQQFSCLKTRLQTNLERVFRLQELVRTELYSDMPV